LIVADAYLGLFEVNPTTGEFILHTPALLLCLLLFFFQNFLLLKLF